ncbi:MAG TPA: DHH family phosphoesterase [Candidatus Syntrophoarchaeum butanivorans]|uniref:DHH family phosphoesterase n=1 Tax=Candidatus Syntropharchaeum butanivorans TaxID=1839936 RepID=A0A1F2P3G1_9EURY|nr:MAG: single-stranded DNA-specific exonuclease [Candidatus Syntrophoarchaeum butanivorans]HEC56303.1 DHH family phosphoesterase [Candidatus Syntrophoarchaeum butanivorans]
MIERLKDAAKRVASRIREHEFVRVISHHDADGITSAGVICHALVRSGIQFHATLLPRLDEEIFNLLAESTREGDLLLFCDMGSNQGEILRKIQRELGLEIAVIDHHRYLGEISPGVSQINPHDVGIEGAFEVSASGCAYLVAEKLGDNLDLAGLAILGAIGDKQRMIGVNREILDEAVRNGIVTVKEGLKLADGDLKEELELSIDPYFKIEEGIGKFLDDLGIDGRLWDLSPEDEMRLADALISRIKMRASEDAIADIVGDRYILHHEVIPDSIKLMQMLDACGKMRKTGLALSLCLRDPRGLDEASEVRVDFQRRVVKELEGVDERIREREGFRYIFAEDRDITGALAGGIIRYLYPDKPIFVINRLESITKISARGTRAIVSSGIDLSEIMRIAASKVGGVGGGHSIAAGGAIPVGSEEEFIEAIDELL